MRIAMQIVIEDYVHNEKIKLASVMANNFFLYRGGAARSTRSSNCQGV
jgi:succinate dehydrogenase hydrophobic anchor subunit